MKFNKYSDEETCSEVIHWKNHEVICMRTKGHKGDHIPEVGKAGEADGVRWCCRVKLTEEHSSRCPLSVETVLD